MATLKINAAGQLLITQTGALPTITCPSACSDPTFSDAFSSSLNSTYVVDGVTASAHTTAGQLFMLDDTNVYRPACVPSNGETWDLSMDIDWISAGSSAQLGTVQLGLFTPGSTSTPVARITTDSVNYTWEHVDGAGSTSGTLGASPADGDSVTVRITRNSTTSWDFKFIVNGTTELSHTSYTYDPGAETLAWYTMQVTDNTTDAGWLVDNFAVA